MQPIDFFKNLQNVVQSRPLEFRSSLAIFDTSITLAADNPKLFKALFAPVSQHFTTRELSTKIAIEITIEQDLQFSFPWQSAPTVNGIQEFSENGIIVNKYGANQAIIAVNTKTGQAIGLVNDSFGDLPHDAAHLTLRTMYQLLKPHDFYLLHAAAVSDQKKALLFVGASGAGKTTTLLHCLSGGFTFLADDVTFVKKTDNKFQAISSLNTINVTQNSAQQIPALRDRRNSTSPDEKNLVSVLDVFPNALTILNSPIYGLILPVLEGRRDGSFEQLSPLAALQIILPSSVDVSDPIYTQKHVKMLRDLVTDVPAFQFHLPAENAQIPELIREKLSQLAF